MLAKVFGSYSSIPSEMVDLIELQTYYARQEIGLTSKI